MNGNRRRMRTFNLYESQNRRKTGGKSKFREFLAGVGHTFKPILNRLASGLMSKGASALAQRFGKENVLLGSELLGSVAQGKAMKEMAKSDAAKKLLKKGLDHIKIGGGLLPPDIEEKITPRNKRALKQVFGKKRKKSGGKGSRNRKRKKTKKPVGRKRKIVAGRKKAVGGRRKKAVGGRKKKAGGRKKKKGILKKKAAGKKRGKKTAKKTVKFAKPGKGFSIFD